MLNVEIDPRGGVFTRAGFVVKHDTNVVGSWVPRGLFNYKHSANPQIMLSTGNDGGAVNGKVYYADGGNFTALNYNAPPATALAVTNTNGASFTQWENTVYIALGQGATVMYKWTVGDTYATALPASGPTWQAYQVPIAPPATGYMPRANIMLAHANKMFVANTYEDGTAYPNRLRWSHENLPENWFQQDYIDIIAGGEGIRGIQIVDGQLLIFKPKAVYLLMGYDVDNFALVEVSTNLGIDYPQHAVAGAGGVFFFDYPNGLYFYDRNGIQDIFAKIRPMIINKQVNSTFLTAITLSFINNRLWVSLPYDSDILTDPLIVSLPDYASVNLVFDPTIGPQGAYTMFQSSTGFGLLSGCDWRDGNDASWHLMINPDSSYPRIYAIDQYNTDTLPQQATDDFLVGATPSDSGDITTQYTTSWFDDDRYVQLKTFIRPYFVLKEPTDPTQLFYNVYYDFDELRAVRGTRQLELLPLTSGAKYGIDVYGVGVYGNTQRGSIIKRRGVSQLGKARAVQIQFIGPTSLTSTTVGRQWGLNSISYKYKRRKVKGI